jgi:hypothetical protein
LRTTSEEQLHGAVEIDVTLLRKPARSAQVVARACELYNRQPKTRSSSPELRASISN